MRKNVCPCPVPVQMQKSQERRSLQNPLWPLPHYISRTFTELNCLWKRSMSSSDWRKIVLEQVLNQRST